MIGRLTGTILQKQAPELLLEVNGVGYEINAPMTTFYKLPEEGQQVSLHTHLVVREDAHLLYGFFDVLDRALFKLLIRINGVGPKLALTILSGMDTQTFVRCIHNGDSSSLVRVPGIGKKTAERLLIEMRDYLKDWQQGNSVAGGVSASMYEGMSVQASARRDAESALLALGYKTVEAARAIAAIRNDELSSEEMIRLALQNMN